MLEILKSFDRQTEDITVKNGNFFRGEEEMRGFLDADLEFPSVFFKLLVASLFVGGGGERVGNGYQFRLETDSIRRRKREVGSVESENDD